MAGAACASGLGAGLGPWLFGRTEEWSESLVILGVADAQGFNRVAGMHTGAYAGAGLALLYVMVRERMRAMRDALN